VNKTPEEELDEVSTVKYYPPAKPHDGTNGSTPPVKHNDVDDAQAQARPVNGRARSPSPPPGEGDPGAVPPDPPPHPGDSSDPRPDDDRPAIRIEAGKLAELATRAEAVLIAAKAGIYRRGETLVRPVVETAEASHGRKTKIAQLAIIDIARVRDELSRATRFEKYRRREKIWEPADPPLLVAETILDRYGEWTFPPVNGVITTPTLRADGSILSASGYDPETRLVLMDPPELPHLEPTRENAEQALLRLDQLLDEVPFADEESRSVALSAMITPVVRAAFPVAPLHIISSPEPGAGKSYVCDIASSIATGQAMPVKAAGRTEEETEKRLASALLAAQPLICLDNCNGELGGDFLCQAVERPIVDVRPLGQSKLVRVETRSMTFYATGINISPRRDMIRRGIRCTIDPRIERPELRQFRGDPVANVLGNHALYLASVFVIVRAYLAAGQPGKAPRLASFEGWSDLVRSTLIWLCRADPCATMEAVRADDPERSTLEQMLSAWERSCGVGYSNRYTASEMVRAIEEKTIAGGYRHENLRDACLAIARHGRIDAAGLGYWLRSVKGKVALGRRFRDSPSPGRGAEWWIEPVA
jgi:putative DNA primase/helicase